MKKENEAIKDRIIRDITNLFKQEKKDCYKPVRVANFWSRNYIKYESNGGRNKTLSVKEYLNKIKLYLKDIINDLKKFDSWKSKSKKQDQEGRTRAIICISSKDADVERVMHYERKFSVTSF